MKPLWLRGPRWKEFKEREYSLCSPWLNPDVDTPVRRGVVVIPPGRQVVIHFRNKHVENAKFHHIRILNDPDRPWRMKLGNNLLESDGWHGTFLAVSRIREGDYVGWLVVVVGNRSEVY